MSHGGLMIVRNCLLIVDLYCYAVQCGIKGSACVCYRVPYVYGYPIILSAGN